jgi:ABC-type Fe3+ transport system permease subunit
VANFWVDAVLKSLKIVAGVSALSLIIALPMAWLVERTDVAGFKQTVSVEGCEFDAPLNRER